MTSPDLPGEVARFTAETESLLRACFDNVPGPSVESHGDRVVVKIPPIVLTGGGQELAELHVVQRFCLDSTEQYLAVDQSVFKLNAIIDRTPVFRYDYDRQARSKPSSHLQVHAHRGALSHLLSQAGHTKPHELAALHFPTGGARFRPCLEDVAEFLIRDFRLDARQGWERAVHEGRERWRRLQLRATVRDMPRDAAEVLTGLGYQITRPADGDPHDSAKALHNW